MEKERGGYEPGDERRRRGAGDAKRGSRFNGSASTAPSAESAAITHSDSALGAFYRRLCSRMDKPSANTAVAHKLARMVYFMLTRGSIEVRPGQGDRRPGALCSTVGNRTISRIEFMRFKDKVVVVTGGASGIGLQTAELFAAEGATVGINDLRLTAAQEAADRIRRNGGNALAIGGDVSDMEQVQANVKQVLDRDGKADVAYGARSG